MSKQLIVLLSRQRSGTNAFRAVIDSHAELHCYEEVLNPDEHYLEHDWSYFNYLRANCSVERVASGQPPECVCVVCETIFTTCTTNPKL